MSTRLREVLRCVEAKPLVRGRGVGRLVLILLTAVFLVSGARAAKANWQTTPATPANASEQHATQAAEPEEHGLSPKAVEIGRVFGLPVTNSMFVSWVFYTLFLVK